MRICLLLFVILAGCFERDKSSLSKVEESINICDQIELEDGSLIELNPVYFDTLNIDSISISRQKIRSSIANQSYKGKFFFQNRENYNLISDTNIINTIYTKYQLSNSHPSAISIKQNGCEFSLHTSLSPLELNNLKSKKGVICSVYIFLIHCSERQYKHLIIYKIEDEK